MRAAWTIRDGDIRTALRRELHFQHANDPDTVLIEEMSVLHGTSRMDLAVVNGSICGYEVKSDRDTLERLPEQADAFSSVFDFVTLVIGERHLKSALDLIPDWWGIKAARIEAAKLFFCDLKLPLLNPAPKAEAIVRLLWHNEALAVAQELCNLDGYTARSREHIYVLLTEHSDMESLRAAVRRSLKSRANRRFDGLPPSNDD